MQLNELQKSSGISKARRIGRGGKRGKTSGKGHKGQSSRAGRKIRPAERDFIKKIPKRRGHGKNRSRTVNPSKVRPVGVNLAVLELAFEAGDRVDPRALVIKGVLRPDAGRAPVVKILGVGTLTKKLTIVNCEFSATAKMAIEKVGGSVS
ncbi:MAG: uL15 family ribosomal protein [Candidatus Pacebacteria bacterium]|nr:uL15 family ribosomal protein [Candidatus Paceibacterota bacterium]